MSRFAFRILVATALVASGVMTSATPASAAPNAASAWSVSARTNPDGTSVTVPANVDTINELSASVSLGPDWAGWATPKKGKWKFTVNQPITMNAGEYSDFFAWGFLLGTSSTNPDCFEFNWMSPNSLTLKSNTCADTVSFTSTAEFYEAPPTDATTFDTNVDVVRIIANGVTVTPASGLTSDVTLDYAVPETDELVVDASDIRSVSVAAQACVDESLVSAGNSATVVLAAAADSTPLTTTSSDSTPWVEWGDGDLTGATNGDSLAIHSYEWWTGDGELLPLENVSETFRGTINLPSTGTYTLTASADLRRSGSSILEPCPPVGEVWPIAFDTSISDATIDATSSTNDLPGGMVWNTTSLSLQKFTADGFGGFFTSTDTSPDSDPPTFAVSHFDADGGTSTFGPSGSLANLPNTWLGEFSAQRWGTGGDDWLSWSGPNWDDYSEEFIVGDFSGSEPDTVAISIDEVNSACNPAKKTGDSILTPLAIQTATPYLVINCSYKLGKKGYTDSASLATIDPSGDGSIGLVQTLVPNPAKPASLVAEFTATDPTASGTDIAVWVYTEVTTGAKKTLQTFRTVTTMTANGVTAQSSLNANPFPSGTPERLRLVPGATNGDWKGLSVTPQGTVNIVTVTGGTTISERSAPSSVDDYGYNSEPLAVTSTGRLAVGVSSVAAFDSVVTLTTSVGLLSTDGASVSWGEEVSTDVYTDYLIDWLWAPLWGSDGSGNPVNYLVTSPTEYQVVTWDLP